MKKKLIFIGLICFTASTQLFAQDSIKALLAESHDLSAKEKILFEKISDPNRDDIKELRCIDVPKLMNQRISIINRTEQFAKPQEKIELENQKKLIESKLKEAKKAFEC